MTETNIPEEDNFSILGNNLPTTTFNAPKVLIQPSKCRNILCPDCAFGRVVKRRFELYEATRNWKGAVLVVLTVDPKRFGSPEEAWIYLKGGRFSRFAREINKDYFYFLEFHENGWPHWNLVVNSNWARKTSQLARERWRHGNVSNCKCLYNPGIKKRCINYAVKSSSCIPDWLLKLDKQIRLFGSSQGLIPKDKVKKPRPHVYRGGKRKGRRNTTAIERLNKCGQACEIIVLRDGKKHFVCELSKEHGEALEQLDFLEQCSYLREQVCSAAADRLEKLCKKVLPR